MTMAFLSAMKENFASPQNTKRSRQIREGLGVFLFLLPGLVVFLLFVIYPIFRSVYFSTFDWNGLGPAVKNIGIENYKKILADAVFLKSIKNVIIIIILSLEIGRAACRERV